MTELRRLFGQFDDDGSGFIEPSEFLPLLAKLLRQPVSHLDPAEVWRSWEDVDESHSGRILVEQFTHWYCNTFNVAAPDFTQFINQDIIPESEKLIREVAKKLGKNTIMIEKIYREFNKLDADNSGFLEFPEFEQLMVHELSPDKKSAQVGASIMPPPSHPTHMHNFTHAHMRTHVHTHTSRCPGQVICATGGLWPTASTKRRRSTR